MKSLRYLYVGVKDFSAALSYYRNVIGASMSWHLEDDGVEVAAFEMGEGPVLLIASHRPAPGCMPVYAVDNLEATVREWTARGWRPLQGPIEIPNGPCYTFADPDGNEYAVFEETRPGVMAHFKGVSAAAERQ